jgi:3-phosphoshikimate 1-carboxyvinyltransferase
LKTLSLPTSKSQCNRYLILNALAGNTTQLVDLSQAEDTQILIKLLHQIHTKTPDIQTLNCGDAGTVARFLAAYCSVQSGTFILRGSPRLQQRPMGVLVDVLCNLGANIVYLDKINCLPLQITGKKLQGGTINIDASVSSQYISALMLVAPTLPQGLCLVLQNTISSQPYIQLTAQCLADYGIKTQFDDNKITLENQIFMPPKILNCEGDWSAASYWYGWVGLGAVQSLILKNLYANSTQGDAAVAQIFGELGVKTTYLPEKSGILLEKIPITAQNFEYDCTPTPDLAPTLMSYCAAQGIATTLTGLHTLRLKESNRAVAMQAELNKFSIEMQLINDENTTILYQNNDVIHHTNQLIHIHTHNDHRIAMAMSLWAAKGCELIFDDETVVKKSYPDYWAHLKQIKER